MSYSGELKKHLQTIPFKNSCCMDACAAGYEGRTAEFVCEGCRGAFLRGVFFRYGYLSPPDRETLLTFSFRDDYADTVAGVLEDAGLEARRTQRKNKTLIYMKRSDDVSDLLALIGATRFSLQLLEAQVDKQVNGELNRQVNAETANLARAAAASADQRAAIQTLMASKKYLLLPNELKEAAELRLAHPEASLAELAAMTNPPLTKSGLNHRLQKLVAFSKDIQQE